MLALQVKLLGIFVKNDSYSSYVSSILGVVEVVIVFPRVFQSSFLQRKSVCSRPLWALCSAMLLSNRRDKGVKFCLYLSKVKSFIFFLAELQPWLADYFPFTDSISSILALMTKKWISGVEKISSFPLG